MKYVAYAFFSAAFMVALMIVVTMLTESITHEDFYLTAAILGLVTGAVAMSTSVILIACVGVPAGIIVFVGAVDMAVAVFSAFARAIMAKPLSDYDMIASPMTPMFIGENPHLVAAAAAMMFLLVLPRMIRYLKHGPQHPVAHA